ncbi:hypothetical protein GCM10011391_09900 [Pullulanibacillus camelliae]|uniref:DUF3231 family protein n=1 Tax=Pullulanibacillus camelliae TaxID=1707096 RepID=A0A8J2VMW6_9BACL|nr:DUF3231 family protein [Pullulanibacillus camelliae]GGE33266.1 hypothetical protein GCM10011391_09900 [Pullulanibacillus camelliae]
MTFQSDSQPKLTSAELASLWTDFLQNTMTRCIFTYFLKDVEDKDIRNIIQSAYTFSDENAKAISEFFSSEHIPLPVGFQDKDVNLNAPRLYSDLYMLFYIENTLKAGLISSGGALALCARSDIREFFSDSLFKTTRLYNQTVDQMASKGILVRAPYIEYPNEVDQVDSHKYLSGLSLFNKKRPLNAIEIAYLHTNIQTNLLGAKLALSFAQSSAQKNVQRYMLRGANISEKHIKLFTDILINNDIQPPISSDHAITDSTTPPFSDKLMMFHMSVISALGTGNYATAAAASQRSDLIVNYERLSAEIAEFAKDGADIMINNAWLEQPPTTTDKELLAKKKDKR